MNTTLVVLGVWAAYVTAVHVFGGARRVVRPFREAAVEPFARGTLLVVWHMATWLLVTLTGAILLAAISPRFEDLVLFAGLQAAGAALVFVVTARHELGAAIRLPQWLLLGPLALGLLATRTAHPAATTAGALIAMLGVGHLVWAFGATWPARDREQLAAHVAPRALVERSRGMPTRTATLAVTVVLFAMSACFFAPAASIIPVVAIASVFALRGILGLAYWTRAREERSAFYAYNRFMYSPGCLLIAALAAASLA